MELNATTRRTLAVLLAAAVPCAAHDLFFRPRPFFPQVDDPVEVRVLSGSFDGSENAIKRDRLADLSLLGPKGRQALDPSLWSEDEPESKLTLRFEEAGTYVIGAALHPRPLALPAKEFNAYLAEEGLDEILALRKTQGRLGEGSKERYTKFLKSIVQVGPAQGTAFGTVFGYAAEIVPLDDPAALGPEATLRVRCLVDGQPLKNAAVFSGGRRPNTDVRLPIQRLHTDAEGVATVHVTAAGEWYVKFVHMTEVHEASAMPDGQSPPGRTEDSPPLRGSAPGPPSVTYDSKWATLSFAVSRVPRSPRPVRNAR